MSQGFLKTSIGKKIVMGITGLFLTTFLIIHVSINACIYFNDGGKTFNAAADFMSHNPVIRILEIGLLAGLLIHMIQALRLTMENKKARPIAYAKIDGSANSKWYSRSMGVLGSLLLIFFVVHFANFWFPTKVAVFTHHEHNSFESMKVVFDQWYFVAIYLVGVGALCYHLLHGIQSAFQTLGINHKNYTPAIKSFGVWFSIIVSLLFASMPIAMHLHIIQ
ncbi:MAG: succinate dehydrogenase cytochrome b subunit [Bacteroidia bacterium]|jgi:succinate dehydrogenase / fumarate reductase cytochrome b subunit|nr:succinate dehydrogenase cytochrome b subunit [Bacteroidia bacterium]